MMIKYRVNEVAKDFGEANNKKVLEILTKYTGAGKKAQTALNEAKAQMKELSEKYSDYEHYPNLKGYYTTTSSFFDFCNNFKTHRHHPPKIPHVL